MDKYFEITKGSKLYNDYFKWLEEQENMSKIFGEFASKHGIESTKFIPQKTRLKIIPTEKDKDNFRSEFTLDYGKEGIRQFKCNCEIGKSWKSTVADMPISYRPWVFNYTQGVSGHCEQRMFHICDKLYGSFGTDYNFDLPAECIEIKASDFFVILESKTD